MGKLSYVERCRLRHRQLKAEFDSNWKGHLIDIADYLLTQSGRFSGRDSRPNDGNRRNRMVLDGTGERALRILAAGMQSGLTSPSRPWFRLGVNDKDLEKRINVRTFLDEVRDRMMSVFSRSNFYSSIHTLYSELGAFGTGAMIVEEDRSNIIRCYPFTMGEYYLAVDASLRVNTFYRRFDMTAVNMLEMFGAENVSDVVKSQAEQNRLDTWNSIIHVVEPNLEYVPGYEDNQNMPYVSYYFEEKGDPAEYLRRSGYTSFPVMAPRWDVVGSEVYGRGPGMLVLPDVMMLQKMQEKALIALDKLVDPPMNAPAKMKNAAATIVSGGVNYFDAVQGAQGFSPVYQIQPDFQKIEYKIEKVQDAIKEGFYNDLFLMLALRGDKEMTAREVAERHEEKLLSVGPVVERLQPELLDLVIDRTYEIMDRFRLLPDPPPELEGRDIEIEYISMLAQAQKMVGVTAIEQTFNFIGGLAALWPEARHKVDSMRAVEEYSRMTGIPARILSTDQEVRQRIQAEAQMMQQQMEADRAEQAVGGVKDLAGIDAEGRDTLAQLAGGISGGL